VGLYLSGDAFFKLTKNRSYFGDFIAGLAIPAKDGIFLYQLFNPLAGEKNSGVIFAAHHPSNL